MTDLALRNLQRAATDGDPHAELRLYRARLRAGEFGEDAGRVTEALECVVATGDPCEATLEVLGLALSGELAHGSWAKILSGSPRPESSDARCNDGRLVHGQGSWWCVQHWRTGYVYEGPPGLAFLDNVTICAAGVRSNSRRRGVNRYVSTWRSGFVFGLPRALEYFAEHLDMTYRPGVGPAIWQAAQRLKKARRAEAKLKSRICAGPLALRRRNEASALVEEIEAEIKALEGSVVEPPQTTD